MSSAEFTIKQGRLDLIEEFFDLKQQSPLHCGDDYTFTFNYVDSDSEAIDITGATITFTIKYTPSDSEVSAVVQVSGSVTDSENGQFQVVLSEDDVTGPERIRAYYDIQFTIDDETSTILYGLIEFLSDITQTVS